MTKKTFHQNGGRTWFIVFWFILPFTVLYSVFTIWPVIQGIIVSFHRWGLMGKQGWVGLENYQKFLGDRFFWEAMQNTTLFSHDRTSVGGKCLLSGNAGKSSLTSKTVSPCKLLSPFNSVSLCDFLYHNLYGISLYGVLEPAAS
jgi:ABC-type uncharacterized transport system permease subunit